MHQFFSCIPGKDEFSKAKENLHDFINSTLSSCQPAPVSSSYNYSNAYQRKLLACISIKDEKNYPEKDLP